METTTILSYYKLSLFESCLGEMNFEGGGRFFKDF